MEETKEYVVTRTYTIKDLILLLGEGKPNVKIKVSIPTSEGRTRWSHTSQNDAQVLQVEMREPTDRK